MQKQYDRLISSFLSKFIKIGSKAEVWKRNSLLLYFYEIDRSVTLCKQTKSLGLKAQIFAPERYWAEKDFKSTYPQRFTF